MNTYQTILIKLRLRETMKISEVLLSDALTIEELEIKVLGHTLGSDIIEADVLNPDALYLKVEEDEKIIGYISMRLNEDKAEMLNLVIAKEYQNKGYGSALMKYVFNELSERQITSLVLDVRVTNKRAIKFYKSHGFKFLLVRKNFYIECDALVYIWEDNK